MKLANTRALVIDDDEAGAKLTTLLLRYEGCDAHFITDGAKAPARIQELDPHIVVLELVLEGVNGFDLVRRVRERSALTTIITLTTFNGDQAVADAKAAGADAYVKKPIDPGTFADVVHRTLGGKHDLETDDR